MPQKCQLEPFYAKAVKIEKNETGFIKECLSYTEFEFKTLQKSVLFTKMKIS